MSKMRVAGGMLIRMAMVKAIKTNKRPKERCDSVEVAAESQTTLWKGQREGMMIDDPIRIDKKSKLVPEAETLSGTNTLSLRYQQISHD